MKWKTGELQPESQNWISENFKVSSFVAQILSQRFSTSAIEEFITPKIHDPFLMKNMRKAIDLLLRMISDGKRILLYGDYDVDGTTCIAVAYLFLQEFHKNIDYYISDRFEEGYGISARGLDYAKATNCDLIIALDCGTSSIAQIKEMKEAEIQCIVCDHHQPGRQIPDAVLLNPKQKDCTYPFKELSACGVVFKFLEGFCLSQGWDKAKIYRFIDFVAISTCCDIVNMQGENRALVQIGLEYIQKSKNIAVQTLVANGKIAAPISTESLVFGVGPVINAAGRISHANHAVTFLIERNPTKSQDLLNTLVKKNLLRKQKEATIVSEAQSMLQNERSENKAQIVFSPAWHKGIIGIVASKLLEQAYLPTIVLTKAKDKITGSARSIEEFNLYESLTQCKDLLHSFGGHHHAAGLTLAEENLEPFKKQFYAVAEKVLKNKELEPTLWIDFTIALSQVNEALMTDLDTLAPFGPKHLKPIFLAEKVSWYERPALLKEQHIKGKIQQNNSKPIDVIGFSMPEHFETFAQKKYFDVCFAATYNIFNNRKTISLQIKDLREHQEDFAHQ